MNWNDKEQIKEYFRRYYHKNKEKIRKNTKRYLQNNVHNGGILNAN